MEGLGESGVSDLVVVAVMFFLIVLSSSFLLGFEFDSLETVADRQMEAKVSQYHRTLEKSEVRPGITCLEGAAEQLILEQPRVDDGYLRSWFENTNDFLLPEGYGVEIELHWDSRSWEENYREIGDLGENFFRKGSILLVTSGGEIVSVKFEIRVFEILSEKKTE